MASIPAVVQEIVVITSRKAFTKEKRENKQLRKPRDGREKSRKKYFKMQGKKTT